jgi:hypothetical protein
VASVLHPSSECIQYSIAQNWPFGRHIIGRDDAWDTVSRPPGLKKQNDGSIIAYTGT